MSNKEQFDNIEGLIRKAAEESRPDFDEAAWMKMNSLLDENLQRRRVAGWLWLAGCLLLLLGGAAYFVNRTMNQEPNPTSSAIAEKSKGGSSNDTHLSSLPEHQQPSLDSSNNIVSYPAKSTDKSTVEMSNDAVKPAPAATADRSSQQHATAMNAADQQRSYTPSFSTATAPGRQPAVVVAKRSKQTSQLRSTTRKQHLRTQGGTIETVAEPSDETIAAIEMKDQATPANPAISSIEKVEGTDVTELKNKTTTSNPAISTTNKAAVIETTVVPKQPDSLANMIAKVADKDSSAVVRKPVVKKASTAKRGVYLLGMAGADMGSVRLLSFSNSKVIFKYGAGIGYQLNKHWSVQTGFFISNKQYTAGAGDYKPKNGSYWYGVDIRKVDAACMIFEIPLSVRFNFVTRSSTSFYAMAGASSYIMKKEDYHYHYMRYGQYYQKYWQYTGNRNWMADVTIAAGIEKRISAKWAVLAEPSVSIPVAGIGDGNVRLFSAAIQVGAKWMPF